VPQKTGVSAPEGKTLAARPLAPTGRLQKLAGPPKDPKLQDSLAALEQAAEGVTRRAAAAGSAAASSTVPGRRSQCSCRRFTIGRARASAPSRVDFFDDRLEYDFKDERRDRSSVRMVMYFRDMRDARVDYRRPALVFRVARPLEMFTADYNPADPDSVLRVEFDEAGSLSRHVEALLPTMRSPGA